MAQKKILLVEDDQFLHQLYSDLLKNEQYDVTGTVDGTKAFEMIKKNTWDLILLDVMLPGMDGFEIMDTLIKEQIELKCPVIFLTNLDASDNDKKRLSKAADHWIKSDMSPPQFVEKVNALLK